jgi:ligand-binding SRPBCC domain-containing protein
MTVLHNTIRISAPPEVVWQALTKLDALHLYDPGVKKAEIVSSTATGLGAERRCDLVPGGWFKERVAEWRPNETLAFELFECTLPVRRLRHRYALRADRGGTTVEQHMEYELKYGLVGRLMDAMLVRRKWDNGVKGFFAGLKAYVEGLPRA